MNSNKIILDLCGGTGSWSAPYKAAGYDYKGARMTKRAARRSITYSGFAQAFFTFNQ